MRRRCTEQREIQNIQRRGTTNASPSDVPVRVRAHHCPWPASRPKVLVGALVPVGEKSDNSYTEQLFTIHSIGNYSPVSLFAALNSNVGKVVSPHAAVDLAPSLQPPSQLLRVCY